MESWSKNHYRFVVRVTGEHYLPSGWPTDGCQNRASYFVVSRVLQFQQQENQRSGHVGFEESMLSRSKQNLASFER